MEAHKASTDANIARAVNEIYLNSNKLVVRFPSYKPFSVQLQEIKEKVQLPEIAYSRTLTKQGAPRATAFLTFDTAADANKAKTAIKNARIPAVYVSSYLTTLQHEYKVQVLLPMTKIFRNSDTFGAVCDDYTVKVWRNGSDDEYGSARPPKRTINLDGIDASCLPIDIYDTRISVQLRRLFNWLPAPPAPAASAAAPAPPSAAPSQQVPSAAPTQGEEPTGNSTSDSDNDISMSEANRKRTPSTPALQSNTRLSSAASSATSPSRTEPASQAPQLAQLA